MRSLTAEEWRRWSDERLVAAESDFPGYTVFPEGVMEGTLEERVLFGYFKAAMLESPDVEGRLRELADQQHWWSFEQQLELRRLLREHLGDGT